MLRLTRLMQEIVTPTPPGRSPTGPVVIWNLTRRCNLACRHCYAISSNRHFPGELTDQEMWGVLHDLKRAGVPALILSGGEPLMHPLLPELMAEAKRLGIHLTLSTNGTLLDEAWCDRLASLGPDYVGISLDGLPATHDRFRRQEGAFAASWQALRLCREKGLRVGVRFTLTEENAPELEDLLDLLDKAGIERFYLSHLNYAGRGNVNRAHDAYFKTTRRAMDVLIERCWASIEAGSPRQYVTGNNDADGVYLLRWVAGRFPEKAAHLATKLREWGGNATGEKVANIDNLGNVHPDSMWWEHSLGNVRERPFSEIWRDESDPLLAGLRAKPRPVEGRCAACRHLAICGGNTRIRALQVSGNPWAEDPGCYLLDEEIGLPVAVAP